MRLSTDGIWLDTHHVVSVQQPTTDSLILVLQEHGTDNDALHRASVRRGRWVRFDRHPNRNGLMEKAIPAALTRAYTELYGDLASLDRLCAVFERAKGRGARGKCQVPSAKYQVPKA